MQDFTQYLVWERVANELFTLLRKRNYSVIAATVDDNGLPVTCAIDIMDSDEKGLYF